MSYFDDASLVMIPSGYKTSKVYSVKPTDGSGDLTFSRSNDTATRVNSAGLIEKVRTNLITYSNTFSNAAWSQTYVQAPTANAIANPLTGAVDAWKLVEDGTNNFHYILQTPTFAAGEVSFSFYAKSAERTTCSAFLSQGGNVGASFNLSTGVATASGTGNTASMVSVGGGWYRCIVTNNGSATVANQVRIGVADGALSSYAGDGTSGIYIYAAQAEQGVATSYIATTSAAVSVGPVANVPRLDYLNSSCPRLLLEPQRTNLATYSEQFDNAAWGKASSGTALTPVVTANNAISPDGYQNADTIVFDAGAGTTASDSSALFQTFGGTTATYTGSFYAKTASGTAQIQVRIDGGPYDKFTITNQWQRFTLTKALTGTSNTFEMVIRRGLNEPMNASATIQLWGVQVELGAYATSYIPTLGAAVTRGADTCSKTGISSLIGQTEGTLYAEFVHNGADILTTQTVISINSGNTQNFVNIGVYDGQLNPAVRASSVDILDLYVGPNPLPAGTHKVALAYKSGDFKIYLNGSAVYTSTAAATFGTMGQLDLGTLLSFGLQLGEGIKQALVFKTRLSNADLAALTA